MRTIKFRGKGYDGKWYYGEFLQRMGVTIRVHPYSDYNIAEEHSVILESFGQFTGLYDSANQEIYEGDIVRVNPTTNGIGCIKWHDIMAQFVVKMPEKDRWYPIAHHIDTIVGNIIDNPELFNEDYV